LGLRTDKAGDLWLGNMYQATIVKFERNAQSFKFWPLPPEQNIDAAQVNMVSPESSHVDGKVWTQNNGFAGVHRLDLAPGKIETWEPFKDAPQGEPHNFYDVIPDSQNNSLSEFGGAPRPNGCTGSALVRRVSRRQDRRIRHQDGDLHRMVSADALDQ